MKIHILMNFWHSCVTQCPVLFRFKEWSPASGSKTGGSGVPISIWENYGEVSWMFKLFEFFNMVVIFHKMSGSAKIKTSPATPAYYSCEHAHSRHISSTSHFCYLPEAQAAKKNDPWCLPVILIWSNLIFIKIDIFILKNLEIHLNLHFFRKFPLQTRNNLHDVKEVHLLNLVSCFLLDSVFNLFLAYLLK